MIDAMWGFIAMLVLASLRVPIALAMGIAGFAGLWMLKGLTPSLGSLTAVVYDSGFNYTLSVLPLFILMGNFVTRAGMSKELYAAAWRWPPSWVAPASERSAVPRSPPPPPSPRWPTRR